MRPEKQLERTQRRRIRLACPVKQRRALLKSNPPRDNWIEGDEIKSVSTLGEPKSSPRVNLETFISEPCHALKNLGAPGANRSKKLTKNSLSECPFFRSKHSSKSETRSNEGMGECSKRVEVLFRALLF